MPVRKIIRIAGPTAALVVLAVVTALVTKSQMNPASTAQASPVPTSAKIEPVSHPELRIESIVPIADGLRVDATASLLNFAHGDWFGWYVKVYKEPLTGAEPYKLIKEIKYDQQKFEVKQGEPFLPTFKEDIAVPPGNYSVEVGLVRSNATVIFEGKEEPESAPRPVVSKVGNVTVK